MGNCCVRKEKIKLIDYGQCRACYKVFQKPNERTEHYSPVFITPYLRCSRCNHVFTSKCDEATHKNKVHGKQIYQERVQRAKFADEQRRQTMYEKYRKEREKMKTEKNLRKLAVPRLKKMNNYWRVNRFIIVHHLYTERLLMARHKACDINIWLIMALWHSSVNGLALRTSGVPSLLENLNYPDLGSMCECLLVANLSTCGGM